MYIAPGQVKMTPKDRISVLIQTLSFFDYLCEIFHHDIPNSREQEAENTFLYIDKCHISVINYRNLSINNPKRYII